MFSRIPSFFKLGALLSLSLFPGILAASPKSPSAFELLGGYKPDLGNGKFFSDFLPLPKPTAQSGNLPSSGIVSKEEEEAAEAGEEDPEEKIEGYYDNRKSEIGVWLGASNPWPGSETQKYLDTTLGGGFFFRIPWPWIFYLEMGAFYANYLSATERALTTIPVYLALGYKLPIDLPISFILRAGGGEAFVVARPSNTSRWDPMVLVGLETSFVAGKKIRIGIRIDYNKIYESHLDAPEESKYYYASPYADSRLSNPNYYRVVDAEFFQFGLMVSVFL
ncbi:hypothetical protein EHQ12_05945 [Leptospira gomenensis]|uniref:Outer membrane protein beta-barrel domain-containing protein n=1 Tax=Leptospira gomenensis TaxID=2484974 RepID=A0A5F1Y7R9_9LEPT|nr:hypothetical protein [Leptospira gomenensis]TGK30981.1 hypothetical protein EHQ17_14780 [Leptospira gomenensis]TGK41731.1 hypothetical protein EHQ12_05945 [Leptospira gomenensis]TGK45299.1 hypothetical protein EHQ07_10220 [Leptospira gomenensis]TGK66213.1 hypothetical protein EHQ13_03955 [Leptospira gomenensis]